ncbi:MAG: hypothetical protein RMK89_12410, partial [Armatimonadota bacterium]|nr:hypothetical protein [Armatimonadota bacterium]MDW8144252.1 hypothetical protein [Armatimonadota bacterium]
YFFQSHCGAIATTFPIVKFINKTTFNPTVVRLRPSEKDGLRGQNGRFKALACRRPSVAPKV